jgi:hypothetical protein
MLAELHARWERDDEMAKNMKVCTISMADAGGPRLNIGAPVEKRGRGRPRGSKNKPAIPSVAASSSAPMKRRPGRPVGSKNKLKVSSAAPGPSAPPHNASPPPPRVYSFFCIAGTQCREIQRLPLKFTKFMDGRELREAVLREHSGGGIPYEVEVLYHVVVGSIPMVGAN